MVRSGRQGQGISRVRYCLAAAAVMLLGLLYAWGLWQEQREQAAMSWTLVGKVIVLDPGHGGVDPGAVGSEGTLEKHINLAVAQRLARALRMGGAQVVMTRHGDEDLGTPGKSLRERKREDLQKRVELVQEIRPDVYINIQSNSFGTIWTGAQTFFPPRSPESERLGKNIQRQVRLQLNNTTREAKVLETYILKRIKVPAALVEVGFLSNPQEERLLMQPEYQEKLAWAIYGGIANYLAGEEVK